MRGQSELESGTVNETINDLRPQKVTHLQLLSRRLQEGAGNEASHKGRTAWSSSWAGMWNDDQWGCPEIRNQPLYDSAMEARSRRTAICYDNAAIESLNVIIKTEALYCRFGKKRVKDRRIPVAQLKSAVIEFIDYYNNRRPKRKLGFLSPGEFRRQNPKGTYLMVLTEEQNG